MKKNQNLQLYGLTNTEKKVLLYLDDGLMLPQITKRMDKEESTIYKASKRLRERNLIERKGNNRPYNFRILCDISSLRKEETPGVSGTPQNPLIEVHGSQIVFLGVSDFYSQLKSRRDELVKLKEGCGFDEVEERGNGYLVFRFYWGGFRLLVHKSKLLVKRVSKPLFAPMELRKEGDGVEYAVNMVEKRALEMARDVVEEWRVRLLNRSNGMFKLQGLGLRSWKEHEDGPWVQDRHYVFNYGPGFREDMTKEEGRLKLPLEELRVDFSLGDEAHCEGTREAARDMTVAREARRGGGVLSDLIEEHVGRVLDEKLSQLVDEKLDPGEVADLTADNLLDVLEDRALERKGDGDDFDEEKDGVPDKMYG